MGCRCSFISFVFLLILSTTHFSQARPNPKSGSFSQAAAVNEDELILRGKIGSRPPRCEGKCSSCGHCEAIQVPTNPQVHDVRNSTHFSNVAYARRDDYSNYKPLSWKCKCGNLIFNP